MGEGSAVLTQGVAPDSSEGREYGMSDRVQGAPSPIPGGKEHIVQSPALRHKVPAPAPDEFTDVPVDNAHGVAPGTHTGLTRAQIVRGQLANQEPGPDQYYTPQAQPARPIPVYVVENEDKTPVYRSAAPRNIPIPATGGQPVSICGRDPKRVELLILNETNTTVRIGQTYNDASGGLGALLPASMTSYLKLKTQDTLYAMSTSSTAATLSVIQVFDQGGTEL
jgi:hypothetical protein